MPKVLIYAPVIGRGGVHRMITRLIQHWKDVPGWEFVALSQAHDEGGAPIDWQGIELVKAGKNPPKHPHLFKWLNDNQAAFVEQWRKIKPDLAYFPMPWWTVRAPDFAPPTPFVITLHDFSWDQLGMVGHEFRGEARIFAQYADYAIFPSLYQMRWALDYYGFRRTRTIYHGHFIPANFLATPMEAGRVREKYGLPERYVLAFHCANEQKDPATILRGQIVARNRGERVPPLVLAGLDTELFIPGTDAGHDHTFASSIQELIRANRFRLGQDLFIVGAVPESDIGGLYAGAQVAVTATRNEGGISGSMFEAFAAHVPCVYPNLPVFSERLTPGEYGYTFPVGNAEALGLAIVDVCHSEKQAYKMAQRAFAFANGRTWGDAAVEYLEVFDGVLQQGRVEA